MSAKKTVKPVLVPAEQEAGGDAATVASVAPKKKGKTKLTLVGPASPDVAVPASLFTSTPASKKKARAEADAAAKAFAPTKKQVKDATAAIKAGAPPKEVMAVLAPRTGTNKSRALAALASGKPVPVEALTEAVYGDGKGFAAHGAGMAGVLIGVSLAAVAAGKKLVKDGKGAAASYSLK